MIQDRNVHSRTCLTCSHRLPQKGEFVLEFLAMQFLDPAMWLNNDWGPQGNSTWRYMDHIHELKWHLFSYNYQVLIWLPHGGRGIRAPGSISRAVNHLDTWQLTTVNPCHYPQSWPARGHIRKYGTPKWTRENPMNRYIGIINKDHEHRNPTNIKFKTTVKRIQFWVAAHEEIFTEPSLYEFRQDLITLKHNDRSKRNLIVKFHLTTGVVVTQGSRYKEWESKFFNTLKNRVNNLCMGEIPLHVCSNAGHNDHDSDMTDTKQVMNDGDALSDNDSVVISEWEDDTSNAFWKSRYMASIPNPESRCLNQCSRVFTGSVNIDLEAIICINAEPKHWPIYAALEGDDLLLCFVAHWQSIVH